MVIISLKMIDKGIRLMQWVTSIRVAMAPMGGYLKPVPNFTMKKITEGQWGGITNCLVKLVDLGTLRESQE